MGFLHARIDKWFLSRVPPGDTLELTQRNVYILPTRAGWMLFVTLMVLLVASINYQLNLGYLLTFLLAGSVMVGVHMGHANLCGLSLHLMAPEAQYAGTAAVFRIVLHNTRRRVRFGIGLSVRGSGRWAWGDVPAQSSETIDIAFQPEHRGLHAVPPLTAETRFPLGTFRVWTVWRPAASLLVYPTPEAHPPPLPTAEHPVGLQMSTPVHAARLAGEYDGVRAYRRGDPLKLVVWKKAARAQAAGSDDLFSRDTQQAQQHELWLDVPPAMLPDREARVSRLCAWVLMADRIGIAYGLRIGAATVKPSSGEAHRRRCLEVLATC